MSLALRLLALVLGPQAPVPSGPVGLLRRSSARPADLDAHGVY